MRGSGSGISGALNQSGYTYSLKLLLFHCFIIIIVISIYIMFKTKSLIDMDVKHVLKSQGI
jgi:hypothetical protein